VSYNTEKSERGAEDTLESMLLMMRATMRAALVPHACAAERRTFEHAVISRALASGGYLQRSHKKTKVSVVDTDEPSSSSS
jgi:hypothetical protein